MISVLILSMVDHEFESRLSPQDEHRSSCPRPVKLFGPVNLFSFKECGLVKLRLWKKVFARNRIMYLECSNMSTSELFVVVIVSYLCNWCLSPLTLWVQTPFGRGVLNTTLCDWVCQWFAAGRWCSPGSPVSSINKTDHHDIIEILLKVALHPITLILW
jgi:hypothetical protein